jgi:hypothetical protein
MIDAQHDNGTPAPDEQINDDDDDDCLGSPSTSSTLPSARPKPLSKWSISTNVVATQFLAGPSEHYHDPFLSPPWAHIT